MGALQWAQRGVFTWGGSMGLQEGDLWAEPTLNRAVGTMWGGMRGKCPGWALDWEDYMQGMPRGCGREGGSDYLQWGKSGKNAQLPQGTHVPGLTSKLGSGSPTEWDQCLR